MDGKGRHVASGSSAFLRDLVVMGVGIVIVGVLLYGGLSLLASLGDDGAEVAGSSVATTTEPVGSTSLAPTTTTTAPTTTTTTEPTTTVPTLREPGEVTVLVLNSTDRSGIAGALTQRLAEAGYQTLEADNYEEALEQSRVWHAPDYAPEAVELKELAVPDALTGVYEGPDLGADIVVVIGATYEG